LFYLFVVLQLLPTLDVPRLERRRQQDLYYSFLAEKKEKANKRAKGVTGKLPPPRDAPSACRGAAKPSHKLKRLQMLDEEGAPERIKIVRATLWCPSYVSK
jgi:hypothetical protein